MKMSLFGCVNDFGKNEIEWHNLRGGTYADSDTFLSLLKNVSTMSDYSIYFLKEPLSYQPPAFAYGDKPRG